MAHLDGDTCPLSPSVSSEGDTGPFAAAAVSVATLVGAADDIRQRYHQHEEAEDGDDVTMDTLDDAIKELDNILDTDPVANGKKDDEDEVRGGSPPLFSPLSRRSSAAPTGSGRIGRRGRGTFGTATPSAAASASKERTDDPTKTTPDVLRRPLAEDSDDDDGDLLMTMMDEGDDLDDRSSADEEQGAVFQVQEADKKQSSPDSRISGDDEDSTASLDGDDDSGGRTKKSREQLLARTTTAVEGAEDSDNNKDDIEKTKAPPKLQKEDQPGTTGDEGHSRADRESPEKEDEMESDASRDGGEDKEEGNQDESLAAKQDPPSLESVLASTKWLFEQVDDKNTVTVKDIIKSLSAEYGCDKFEKSIKKAIKEQLTELVQEHNENDDEDNSDEDNVSDVGDVEDSDVEEEDNDDDDASHVPEEDDEVPSDYEDELKQRNKKKKWSMKKKSVSAKNPVKRGEGKKKRISAKKLKQSAMRIQAEKLRKRRMEELRVRNEELQIHQNEQDQKRAELIASKFDTNTDEQRIQRLEHRIGLLQKLDLKRSTVIQMDKTIAEDRDSANSNSKANVEQATASIARNPEICQHNFSDDDDDSSDDDMELEVVGAGGNINSLGLSKVTALSLLDMADSKVNSHHLKMAVAASKKKNESIDLSARIASSGDGTGYANRVLKPQASPGRSLSARAALKNKLLSKQRKMGNMWLARELGYKSEQDHLRDCLEVEQRKRQLVLKLEQERLKKNEIMRERLLDDGEEDEEEVELEEEEINGGDEAEEDEEMALAKAIENEAEPISSRQDDQTEGPALSNDGVSSATTAKPVADESQGTSSALDAAGAAPSPTEEDELCVGENPVFADDDSLSDQLETQAPWPTAPGNSNPSESNETTSKDHNVPSEYDPEAANQDSASFDFSKAVEGAIPDDGAKQDSAARDKEDGAVNNAPCEANDHDENTAAVEKEVEAPKPRGPRNAAWQAILKKEAAQAKKMKGRKNGLVEEEADEEEEEEVAGLEDFGFSVSKKNKDDADEEPNDDEINDDDLEAVVDDLSDDEGDEEEGDKARKELERKEEKERHKEIIRRMRNGYDGRRGGIAVGGAGARGMHRFDELVAADNREDAKRLGLLNDDELDSDDEEKEFKGEGGGDADEEEDEAALLDKMLKDRFLHRSSIDLEENFSEDEEEDMQDGDDEARKRTQEEQEEVEQELLAKRFAKRARMQRVIEAHAHEEEFSQSNLIDEDTTLKLELQKMKVRTYSWARGRGPIVLISRVSKVSSPCCCVHYSPFQNGLARKRSTQSSSSSTCENKSDEHDSRKKQKTSDSSSASSFSRFASGGCLARALAASQRPKQRTSFLRSGSSAGSNNESTASFQKSIAFSHVVFQSADSRSNLSNPSMTKNGPRRPAAPGRCGGAAGKTATSPPSSRSASLWSKAVGFQKSR